MHLHSEVFREEACIDLTPRHLTHCVSVWSVICDIAQTPKRLFAACNPHTAHSLTHSSSQSLGSDVLLPANRKKHV